MVPPSNPSIHDLAKIRVLTPRTMRWGFGAVMAVVLLITALSFWRVELGNRALNEIASHEQVAVEMLYRMQLAARDRTFALFAAVHADDAFEQDREIQRFYEQGAAFGAARAELTRLRLTERERVLLERQREQTARTMPEQDHVVALLEAGRREEAEKWMIERVVPAQNQMIDILSALLDDASVRTREHVAAERRDQQRATTLFIIGGVAGVLLAWGIFLLVSRRMGGLVSRLVDTSERLNDSNLDLKFRKLALDEHNIVSITDPQGTITDVNDKFCEISQYSRSELLGQNHRMLKSGVHSAEFYDDLWATIRAGRVWHGELCDRRKDGSLYWVSSTILPFTGADGLPMRYVAVRTDITAIRQAQQVLERSRDDLERMVTERTRELAEREEILRSITNAAQDAVIMLDPDGRVSYWNPAAEHMFGYTDGEIHGQDLHEKVVPERFLERAREGFAHFSRTGTGPVIGKTTTLQARHRNGQEFPVDTSLSAIKLRGRWNTVGIVRDATARVRTEERLRQFATTDTLTGICNRRRFDELLTSEIHRAARFSSPLSLMLFDVDHFKRVNDTFGHQAGDQVLTQVAVVVSGAIRAVDLFARWGGEEFAVLLPGSDIDAARVLAEKLRMLLENQPFPDVGHITCSFGVAEYAAGDDADAMLKKVDSALYRAKKTGRNRVEIFIATDEAHPA